MFTLFSWHKYRLNKKVLEKITPRTYDETSKYSAFAHLINAPRDRECLTTVHVVDGKYIHLLH